ncbi:CDP-glycerol glycerophosphotransferase family protein [Candidatus Woesearchaeota archaeon]|nr:CDP-glycerol glycerophosphotransferase family protein [Candidatus Woesearchaeota archaeon]
MNHSTYIFIRDSFEASLFKKTIAKGMLEKHDITAVLWSGVDADFFESRGYNHIKLDSSGERGSLIKIRKNAAELVKALPHKKIFDDRSLVELLDYRGFSLWWFVRQDFYTNCVSAVNEISMIRNTIKERKVKKILVLSKSGGFPEAIKEAAKNLNVKITILVPPAFALPFNPSFQNAGNTLSAFFPRSIRVIQGFFRSWHARNKKGKQNILLYTRSDYWSYVKENVRNDAHSYTLLRELSNSPKYNPVLLDVALTKSAAWSSIKENKKSYLPFEYFLFKSFFDLSLKKNIDIQKKRLGSLWEKLDKNDKFNQMLVLDGISLYGVLRQHIKSYFFATFGSFTNAIRNIETARKLMDWCNIDEVICLDENGSSRFLVFAARMSGIPSVGIQHGAFSTEESIVYNYSKSDLYGYGRNLNCQLPDMTAVFGNYFKNLLVKEASYRPGLIAVTGRPQTDIIYENKGKYSKKELCRKLGISAEKRLVLFASQPLGAEAEETFISLASSLKHFKSIHLVVKLHPGDSQSFFQDSLEKMKYKATIVKDEDIFSLIACSDLVISIQSTVILEALLLEKPVIQLNTIEKYENLFGELAEKLIKHVTKESEISRVIKSMLSSRQESRNMKMRKKFIYEYYYKIDGNSSKRAISEAEKLLKVKSSAIRAF